MVRSIKEKDIYKMKEAIEQKKIITLEELSQEMHFSISTIKRLKKQAEEMGIKIQSVIGRRGGYKIEQRN